MCTFKSERAVVVCDVAIDHVRGQMGDLFAAGITYQAAEGGGTLVEAHRSVPAEAFEQAVRQGMRLTESLGK
jgi:hypothetical protein